MLPEENKRNAINIGGVYIKPSTDDFNATAKTRLVRFVKIVQSSMHTRTYTNQFDACVSLAFNIGTGGFKRVVL